MGSVRQNWVSYENAVKKSGYTKEQIDDFVASHLARSLQTAEEKLVSLSDLMEISEATNKPPPLSPSTFRQEMRVMEQKVKRLESAVNLLYEINSLAGNDLHSLTDNSLVELLGNIESLLSQPDWSLSTLLSCAEVYLRLSEAEIQRLEEMTQRKNAWLPFLELAIRQHKRVLESAEVKSNYEWSRCCSLLSRGKDNIRSISLSLTALTQDPHPLTQLVHRINTIELDTFDKIIIYNRAQRPHIGK